MPRPRADEAATILPSTPWLASQQTRRLLIAVIAGLAAGAVSYSFWAKPQIQTSDFSQVWAGAKALREGRPPYLEVGPGLRFDWPFRLIYPLPALVVGLPFSMLPLRVADPLFVSFGAGLLTWALTRKSLENPQLLVLLSLPFLDAIQASQWSPLLVGAVLTPFAGGLLVCKPTIGAALWAGSPSRSGVVLATILVGLSFAIRPAWPWEWASALQTATHSTVPLAVPGGWLILLALLRWRRPESRLLVALSCVPQMVAGYEAVPLFLVARSWLEAAVILVLTSATYLIQWSHSYPTYDAYAHAGASWMVWLVYLPCTVLVLTRQNRDEGLLA